jgi:GT2 family glycosyltransferase
VSQPVVSVIVPAYNAERYVHECLASLLGQTLGDMEILVADDGSMDRTRVRIDSIQDRRIRRFHSDTNLGPGESRNRLLDHARAEFVAFQDADDISLPERFARQVAALRADPVLGMCGTFYESIRPDGRVIRRFEKPLADAEIRLELNRRIPFLCGSLMVRASVVGGERFRDFFNRIGCEDYDLAYRLSERSRMANLPEVLYRARAVSTSFSRTRRSRRQIYVDQVVRALARDRAQTGADCLMRHDEAGLEKLLDDLDRPFRADPALEFRMRSGACLDAGQYTMAVTAAARAVAARPLAVANYRALSYSTRGLLRALWKPHLAIVVGGMLG